MINIFQKALLVFFVFFLPFRAFSQMVHDTLKLHINEQNTLYVAAILNNKDSLTLNFDTGCTDLIITGEVLKTKLGGAIELYKKDYILQLGKSRITTKIYDAELTGHGTEGRFGWNFFKSNVVELDYDQGIMVIHNQLPKPVLSDKSYAKLPFMFMDGLPFIQSEISQNGKSLETYFLYDTGYQRTAMLDNEELQKNHFPVSEMKEIKRVVMHGAQGNEIPVITSELDILKIGKFRLRDVPVQQIIGRKPMQDRNAHILGNEVLKRFNVFMDFKNGFVYLRPNKFWDAGYSEKNNK
ncbi:hypothetical protein GCM10011387_32860 [Pedobacter quisquiliarum]|uniref:Aspartyl protease n=1 Tax=Pedobacter quisquiliarum TaxID=1834438 RepID=A0A916XIV4_9SPHI|nr:aspartyl protease family protein [Pedobacter quisquiliarum]GGC76503.1 hypothetical protein GCM10011387_32860 [Pedobacter quisquiliarum]